MADRPQKIGDLLGPRKRKKPPAYQWQDLALQIIKELNIPNFKRNSVFKVCRDHPRQFVLQSLNDTKELCQDGEKWKYFFKIIGAKETNKEEASD